MTRVQKINAALASMFCMAVLLSGSSEALYHLKAARQAIQIAEQAPDAKQSINYEKLAREIQKIEAAIAKAK